MQLLFGSLFGELSGNLRISRAAREFVREKVRKRLPEFVRLVSDLVADAQGVLQETGFQGLVVLIDGVEKAVTSQDGSRRVADILITPSPLTRTDPPSAHLK